MTLALLLGATLFLAYSNGANDNFKGVATLYGSGRTNYRTALIWATVTTFAGSMAAGLLAGELIGLFSGKGLVADSIIAERAFVIAVAAGASLTVFGAALLGIPISTTHSLTGALAGAGWLAAGSDLNLAVLGKNFFYPLALSPLLAGTLVFMACVLAKKPSATFDGGEASCVCVVEEEPQISPEGGVALAQAAVRLMTGQSSDCQPGSGARYLMRAEIGTLADKVHFLSAGAVGFARGLNDAPKIVAIALSAAALDIGISLFLVALAMALGGLAHSWRIADTLSHKIVDLTSAGGAMANLVTSSLVIGASNFGLPVSTTHVAVSSLFGLGVHEGRANWTLVSGILAAWLLTLPTAGLCAAAIYWVAK